MSQAYRLPSSHMIGEIMKDVVITAISWADWDGVPHTVTSVHVSNAEARRLADAIIEQQHPFVLAVHRDGVPSYVYAPMDIHQ
jgi:hypothetical protein